MGLVLVMGCFLVKFREFGAICGLLFTRNENMMCLWVVFVKIAIKFGVAEFFGVIFRLNLEHINVGL